MLISFSKLKKMAVISAVIIIPFICINLLNISLERDSQPVNQMVENVDKLEQAVNKKVNQQLSEGIGFFLGNIVWNEKRVRGKQPNC